MQVLSIDYSGDKVRVTDQNGQRYEADKVIVTVPLQILKEGTISFSPALPNGHTRAIEDANVWGGIKVFIEFSQQFYPTFLSFSDSETSDGQRVYYDAAYGQTTNANVLGLLAVGLQAEAYQNLTGTAQRDYILAELDAIFNGAASASYVQHLVQDWSAEPFIKAAYLADVSPTRISRNLADSVDDKVYFAGDAYTQEADWGAVHNAARSARDVVAEIVGS